MGDKQTGSGRAEASFDSRSWKTFRAAYLGVIGPFACIGGVNPLSCSTQREALYPFICAGLSFFIFDRQEQTLTRMGSLLSTGIRFSLPLANVLLATCIFVTLVYVVYQRWLHPLSKYPGPFWASLTDLWQVREFLSLNQPYNLTALHEKYGPIVRYGPDKLSITAEEAIPLLYQKGSRNMPKTEFYDAYGAKTPNVFGMRDEDASPATMNQVGSRY